MSRHDDLRARSDGVSLVEEDVEARVGREDANRYVEGVGQALLMGAIALPLGLAVEITRAAAPEIPLGTAGLLRAFVGLVCGAAAWQLLRHETSVRTARVLDAVALLAVGALLGWLDAAAHATDPLYIASLGIMVFVRSLFVGTLPRQTLAVCLLAWGAALVTSLALMPAAVLESRDGVALLVQRHIFVAFCLGIAVWGTVVLQRLRRREIEARSRGRYRLYSPLGEGGMGRVYRAFDVHLERACAVKMLRPGRDRDPRDVQRFETEAKRTGRLASPYAVKIYDFGHTRDAQVFYAMEYLSGRDLAEQVEAGGPQPPAQVVEWLLQASSALHEAHTHGLVHRDIKPANLFLVDDEGGGRHLKVLDFGLSTLFVDPEAVEGGLVGTPDYMAPEQARTAPTDPRTDVYALGAVAFTLLTGERMYPSRAPMAVLMQQMQGPVRRPSEVSGEVPAWLDDVVARCLAKAPEDRFPSMRAVGEALRAGG